MKAMALTTLSILALAGCASQSPHQEAAHPQATDKGHEHAAATDESMARQRANLVANTDGKGFGPQAPRDLNSAMGTNPVAFTMAPPFSQMNLCNIHFHKNAEHKGGEFTTYVGHGDGQGYGTGFKYNGVLSAAEMRPSSRQACPSAHGALQVGDTLEVHYVFSTATVQPGPTLGACLNDATKNPELRVEAQTIVLVNDANAYDFVKLAQVGVINGRQQAPGMLNNSGSPIQYTGSTTGPAFNEAGSPFQVSWSVRPRVAKVNIDSVASWCEGNVFKEDHAHGVRTLVTEPKLLSTINR